METRQIVVILLVVAVVLSLVTVYLELTSSNDFVPADFCQRIATCNNGGTDSGQVSLQILPPPEGAQ